MSDGTGSEKPSIDVPATNPSCSVVRQSASARYQLLVDYSLPDPLKLEDAPEQLEPVTVALDEIVGAFVSVIDDALDFGINVFGDWLRDRLDPTLRGR